MTIIMLGFSQANCSPPFKHDGSDNVPNKLACDWKCDLECAPLVPIPPAYTLCIVECIKHHCPHNEPIDVYSNCITGCRLAKFIDVNDGIIFLINLYN